MVSYDIYTDLAKIVNCHELPGLFPGGSWWKIAKTWDKRLNKHETIGDASE
jgi:hypothetical protein